MDEFKKEIYTSDDDHDRLSMSTENYLLSIFNLEEQEIKVTPTQLAEHLKTLPRGEGMGTSLPSVSGMIRRMVREGLVDMSASKTVVMTTRGRAFASSIVRRHRLAERMVVDLLGLDLHKSHIEAHRLEHAISSELEEKIVSQLGYPTTCPFGHPIPGSKYIKNSKSIPLSKAKNNQLLTIDRIPEDDQSLLEYFIFNKMIPGENISIKDISKSRGVITLSCNNKDIVFGYEISSRIWAYPACN